MKFEFTQIFISKDDNSKISEKGKAYFFEDRWRWDYFGEDKRVYLIKGKKVFQISEDGKEEIDVGENRFNNSILDIIKNLSSFLKKRKISQMSNKLFIYGNTDDEFAKIIVFFSKNSISSVQIFDLEGNIIEFQIKNLKLNIPISRSIFDITKLD